PFGQPFSARRGVTFWAMPVAARVIRDAPMPAGIALFYILHMAAERSSAAVADRLESPLLMSTEYVAPLREELLFVCTEEIGYFEPMFSHRSGGITVAEWARSSEPNVSSGLLAERTALSER